MLTLENNAELQAVSADTNEEAFARRLAEEALVRDYGWRLETCHFLLARHPLEEITSFAKRSTAALRKGLWLYALSPEDVAQAARQTNQGRLKFAWCARTKDIYCIGDAYYALFAPQEAQEAHEQGMSFSRCCVCLRLSRPQDTSFTISLC